MAETELRMTDHELLALLSMTPGDPASTALALFRLEEHVANELLRYAGLTTLLVRGLAEQHGGKVVPVQHCAVVGSVLSQAQEWLEITFTTPTSQHFLFTAGSNVGAVLLTLNPYGVHEVQPIASGPAMLELGLHLCREYLVGAAEGLPATAIIRRLRTGREDVVAQLTAVESGDWELRSGLDSPTVSVSPADALDRFAAVLGS